MARALLVLVLVAVGAVALVFGLNLRTQLIAVPARVASSARSLVMHLPTDWPWATAWQDLWATATTT